MLIRITALVSVPLIGGLLFIGFVLPVSNICGEKERAALAEFPHYGDKELGDRHLEVFPLPGKTGGACVTGYSAKGASQEQISAYYDEKLTGHDWKVDQSPDETRGPHDGLRYVVRY